MRVVPLALVAVLAACTGSDAAPPPTPVVAVTSTTVETRPDDGTLTIGLLLPTTGDGSTLGAFMADGARRAIGEINVAGGVSGSPVEVVAADEGETATEAADAIEQLLADDVDAVIGPASSTTALATLDLLVAADVLTCSPSATSLALDDFPDEDLFFRTAPSDSLQALGLAQLAEFTGETHVAVTWLDDVYGRPFATAAIGHLESRAVPFEIVAEVPFTATEEDLTERAEAIATEDPGVVVLIADREQGARMLTALASAYGSAAPEDIPDIIVNDTLRTPSSPRPIATLPASLRANVQGLAPTVAGSEDLNGPFATNAYDCANLIALAAAQTRPDDPVAMARVLPGLTPRGAICRSYADCVRSIDEGRIVNYEGPAGPVEINADGDPARARFDRFQFSEDGLDDTIDQIIVSG